ncbi:MAG TPA: hypothetical protein VHY84_01680 [Bryobacteraceae bacterium]|jgi:hypothetical protein|nr:hypothetical protein [Bryobacteraceae bacterium]
MTERELLLQGITGALSASTVPEALPNDADIIREVEAMPSHTRTQDQQSALIAAQQRVMADLIRKPNSQVTAEEAAAIRRSALEWMQKGDE